MNEQHFTGKAELYAKARPGYAPAALAFMASRLPTGAEIADIGAGTGKFTALLAAQGFHVTAVEPNDDMRAHLACIPGIAVVNASAEQTGLPGARFDAIACAQAFHWFEPVAFGLECERLLKPGGKLFVVYNNPNPGEASPELDWYHVRWNPGARRAQREQQLQAFFGEAVQCERFPNPREYDRESYLAYMFSHSHSPKESDADYPRFIESVHAIFEHESTGGKLTIPFETAVYTN